MGSTDRPPKQEAFLALLAEGWTSLHLDARRDGVIVPAHLKSESHLVLQYGHDLPIPIVDLQVNEHGVSATLSFARSPSPTLVPWSAVYVVTSADGRGVLYHEDIPGDVSIVAGSAADGDVDDASRITHTSEPLPTLPPERPATPTRALRAVPLSGPLDDSLGIDFRDNPAPEALVPARRRRRPQLRLVK
jgi:stringent starvation protein B